MTVEYKAIPIEQLIQTPNIFRGDRQQKVAENLTEALNEIAESGCKLVTSCKSANGTILIFEKMALSK